MAIVPETAALSPCELIMNPTDPKYTDVTIRQFQGCPTIAATRGGRLYVGWYSGGVREPHIENFNLLVYSDDYGKSWSEPLLVIPSSRERLVHALDIQLWLSPDGRLYVYWVQNNVKPAIKNPDGSYVYPGYESDGYIFNDFTHAEWCVVCDDPDAANPVFGEPRYVDRGFLRCKPLVTSSGRILNFNYDQTSEYYGYSYSDDGVRAPRRQHSYARAHIGRICRREHILRQRHQLDRRCADRHPEREHPPICFAHAVRTGADGRQRLIEVALPHDRISIGRRRQELAV